MQLRSWAPVSNGEQVTSQVDYLYTAMSPETSPAELSLAKDSAQPIYANERKLLVCPPNFLDSYLPFEVLPVKGAFYTCKARYVNKE